MTGTADRERAAAEAGMAASRQRGLRLVAKRLIDLVGASLLLVPASIVMVLGAIAVVLESGRPAFYHCRRLGRHGRPFTLLKLRTMLADADDAPHRRYLAREMSGEAPAPENDVHKLCDDARVTRVGRFLRHWSLDELPQLINVLRGDMSLVGPRPEVDYALEHYEPHHFRRFAVLPGITGLWQVSGRSRVSVLEMLQLDAEYADRWTLWLDLRILVRTLPAVLSREGAGL